MKGTRNNMSETTKTVDAAKNGTVPAGDAKVLKVIEGLRDQATNVFNALGESRTYATGIAPVCGPLAALRHNATVTGAVESLVMARDRIAAQWDQDTADMFLADMDRLAFYADLLAPATFSADTLSGTQVIADKLAKMLDLADILEVSDEVQEAGKLALTAWDAIKSEAIAASNKTTRDVPSRVGSTRKGEFEQEHGYKLVYLPDGASDATATASNPGAMLHDVCQRYAKDHKVDRPRRGEPIWQGLKDGLEWVTNPNQARDIRVSVPGGQMFREYTQ